MGGSGSGNWYRYNRKSTVEESMVLDVKTIVNRGLYPHTEFLTWTRGKALAGSINYTISDNNGSPTLTLVYTFKEKEDIVLPIQIIARAQPYGGKRYWMICPLMKNGWPCNARCSKLYRPPGARYFGCRKCYDLSYNSCNTSHQIDVLYRDYLMKHGYISRKEFYLDMSGKWYYQFFRTKKAAEKWYSKMQK